MDSWYIYNKKQQKQYGPYSPAQIQSFVRDQKMDEVCVASCDQTNWYDAQQLTKIFSVSSTKKIGKFEIIRELGRGGMGVVYHARDTFLKYECAVKFIRLDQGMDDHSTKRFITEAQSIAKLKHPNIIGIKELNSFVDAQSNHLYYFSMDYIKGIPFDEYISQKIPLKEKLQTFVEVCRGVAYAHENNIIHRDLKPANIIVSEEGVPVILDFGLARNLDTTENMTKTGDIIGTPKYIAPEVMQGQKAGASCDTYALGVILYEILTGFPPFTGENMIEILFQVSHTNPIRPSRVNSKVGKESDIEVICLKCLEKKTVNRIHSVQFLCEELQCVIDRKPTKTKPPGIAKKSVMWLKKNKIAAGLAVLALLLTLVFINVNQKLDDATQKLNDATQKLNDANNQLEKAKDKEVASFGDYTTTTKSKLMQFYEKYSSSKGMHSILEDIEEKYRDVEKKLNNDYREILVRKVESMEDFFDSTRSIMRYFVMPSLPKITSSVPIPHVEDIYQVEISTFNDIAITSKEQKMYFVRNNERQHKAPILIEKNRLVAYCNNFYFSPNGKYLAVLFRETEVDRQRQYCSVYDTQLKQEIKRVETKLGRVDAKFSNDSRFLAYCDLDGGASLIDTHENKIIRELCKLKGKNKATNLDFSPDSQYVSFCVHDDGYYVYHIKTQKSRKVGRYRRKLFPVWKDHQLYIYTGQKLERYDAKSTRIQPYIFSSIPSEGLACSEMSPNGNLLLWGTDTGLINYVTLRPKFTAHVMHRRQTYNQVKKISFINEHFFFTLDKENHFYLRDSFSKQTIYHQPHVYYARYDKGREELIVVVAIEEKKQEKQQGKSKKKFYVQRWKMPFVIQKILHPSRNTLSTYNLVTRQIFNEKYMSSKPCIFIKKNNEVEAIIFQWHKGLSIWYKRENRYENFLTFSFLVSVWDVKVSDDNKWVAVAVHNKKLRRQYIIMIESSKLSQLNIQTSHKIVDGVKVKGKAVKSWSVEQGNEEIRSLMFAKNNDLYFSRGHALWKYSKGEVQKICHLTRKIHSLQRHPTRDLIVVCQEMNLFSVINSKGTTLFKSSLQEGKNVFEIAAWCPQSENAMFAITGQEGELYLVTEGKDGWQQQLISVPGKKYQLSFSPDGKMLAIFTSVDTYVYLIKTEHLFPIFSGYNKNNGGNLCSDWRYAAFPTSKARMFLFDLNRLQFENFANYFTKKSTQAKNLWPNKIRDKFFEYIKGE
ncbi:serine/threonine protein kinase [Candidatus Uabimicrobium amorphum]|uniref:Protein kinase n=1 Tax=Uabimicrobium amorphum TaxID=2596890 RepID=A0A5S9ITF8_UABAM|nr:serine/threonine-protein kinase [Candidatus Uabimicrobium amorphum]BBM87614.1 protein kinase [Candidatus Uabimicrobium amorphum]